MHYGKEMSSNLEVKCEIKYHIFIAFYLILIIKVVKCIDKFGMLLWHGSHECHLLSKLIGRLWNSILNRFLLKISFLLSFNLFLPFWLIGLCLLSLLVSHDVNPVLVVLDLHMKYTVEVVPLHKYIVWFVIVW